MTGRLNRLMMQMRSCYGRGICRDGHGHRSPSSELYGEVGEGEGREGASQCSIDVVWGDCETHAVETFKLIGRGEI